MSPDDRTYLMMPKKTPKGGRLAVAGAVVLSFLLGVVLASARSDPSIQPTTSLASDPAPGANKIPVAAASEPTDCGHDASSPCSAQDFLDILDQQNWTLHEPVAVDPNADDCAKNPWSTKEKNIVQGFKKVDGQYAVVGNFAPGSCGSQPSWDPRVFGLDGRPADLLVTTQVFGPHTWKTFHTMAVNYHSPPTEVAVDACTNFLNALPYLIPCAHCAYDLGQFIRTNANKNGLFDSECGGATTEDFDESLCLKPEEACKSQRTLVSFFVRAQNNVNQHVHPCRPRFTIMQAYNTYAEEHICAHSVVWGSKQICGGGYAYPADSPKGSIAGPKGTGTSPKGGPDYYGADADGCSPETALACGTVECTA